MLERLTNKENETLNTTLDTERKARQQAETALAEYRGKYGAMLKVFSW